MASRHTLRWSAQPNKYIPESDLPSNITRHFVQTPGGPLELLVAEPPAKQQRRAEALFFQHGAFGCASVWLPYATYFSELGYPCYAFSLRGHGASWVPGIVKFWWTTKTTVAQDLVAGIEWAKTEEMRKRGSDTASIVLVGHSMGGGLVQYALSEELVKVAGLILLGAAPGSGMLRSFCNLIRVDPAVIPRLLFCGLHPRAMIISATHLRRLMFCPEYPDDKLEDFTQYLAESEAMVWALGMVPKFVDFQRVVQRSIAGLGGDKPRGERILIVVGELDKLMDVSMTHELAKRYRNAVKSSMGERKVIHVSCDVGYNADKEGEYTEDRGDGVRMVVVKGSGHHIQNDLQWEVGAQRIEDFLKQL